MKSPAYLLYSAAACLLSFGSLRAQNNPDVPGYGSSLVSSAPTADEALTSVIMLATSRLDQQKFAPAVSPSIGSPPGLAQSGTTQPGLSPSAEPLSQIDQYIQTSLAAQAYYRAYPGDARVAQAKKMETLFALQSVQLGAESYRQTANTLGTAYRADKSNAATDRFDIAQAMNVIALAPNLKGQRFLDDGVTYEQMADDLYAEFGELDQVYNVYISEGTLDSVPLGNIVGGGLTTNLGINDPVNGFYLGKLFIWGANMLTVPGMFGTPLRHNNYPGIPKT